MAQNMRRRKSVLLAAPGALVNGCGGNDRRDTGTHAVAAGLLPSEKAHAYRARLEEIKETDMESRAYSRLGKRLEASEVLAAEAGESRNQIHRYIRLTELVPDLLDLVDARELPLMTAVDISYINRDTQRLLVKYMREHGIIKSYQVSAVRMQAEGGRTITYEMLERILGGGQLQRETQARQVVLPEARLRQYFPAEYTTQDMERIIVALLEQWRTMQAMTAGAGRMTR